MGSWGDSSALFTLAGGVLAPICPQWGTRGPTPRFRGSKVYGYHLVPRVGTNSLKTRHGDFGGHTLFVVFEYACVSHPVPVG